MSSHSTHEEPGPEPVGSAAEEAARLVEALRRWFDERAPDLSASTADSRDCQLCPICQLLGFFRQGQPEVFEHLSQAADSLLAAVRSGISAHEAHWSRPGSPFVEHIDID